MLFNIVGSKIEKILDEWDGTSINIIEQVKKHNMILVYPILLVFPDNSSDYDEKIKSAINGINKKSQKICGITLDNGELYC